MAVKGKLIVRSSELNLKMMLEGGQSFRWKRYGSDEWVGVFKNRVWSLKQFSEFVEFSCEFEKEVNGMSSEALNCETLLSEYLQLDKPLETYYSQWSERDPHFRKASELCYGIRMLGQDPVENVFSFICSSNNNIARISSMVEKMCSKYGKKITDIGGISYFSFPTVAALSPIEVDGALRDLGFGYRSKFIQQSAEKLVTLGGEEWLNSLKNVPYNEAKSSLMQLPGIGAKVADCICLMSLGHLEAVPVDTHVFQIASQYYLPHLKSVKTVTERVYKEIGNHFRDLYGPYAGWAHTVLFCADLKMFEPGTGERSIKPSKRKKDASIKTSGQSTVETMVGVLPVSKKDLHLRVTFNCGQTYRWKEIGQDTWQGVLLGRVWKLTQHKDSIDFHVTRFSQKMKKAKSETEDCVNILNNYFRLDEPLDQMYRLWAEKDPRFRFISTKFYGLRMTRQDIVENLFAFVCSSNNTISRISTMVEKLCSMYGTQVAEIDGATFYDFPKVETLSKDAVEGDLKLANFGFRAKYVSQCAKYIVSNGGDNWFKNLQNLPYLEAKQELMKLPGIGAKVADCICLTALDHLDTIPVDTHVFQLAKKYYLPQLKSNKTVSEKAYKEISTHFKKLFGKFSGWAHTVLFCSELKRHNILLKE